MSDPNNPMHRLRRFATTPQHVGDSGLVFLVEDEVTVLQADILHALKALDAVWETAAGRKLTDAEKGLDGP